MKPLLTKRLIKHLAFIFIVLLSLLINESISAKEKLELKVNVEHSKSVNSVAFSPDGKRIVSESTDKTVKIWDVSNDKELKTLRGHSAEVKSVFFSPDGKQIVSGSGNTTIKYWDVKSGKLLATTYPMTWKNKKGKVTQTKWVITTPEGYYDASKGGSKEVYFVKGMEVIDLEQLSDEFYRPGLLGLVLKRTHFPKKDMNEILKKLAPNIEIITPLKKLRPDLNGRIKIKVKFKDMGEGVSKIALKRNGTTILSSGITCKGKSHTHKEIR